MQEKTVKNKLITASATAILCLIADMLSKYAVEYNLSFHQKVNLLPNIISLEKVYNTGAAFSILQNQILLLSLISLITVAGIIFFIIKKSHQLRTPDVIGLGFILGGAFGNIFDRFVFGHVVDFIQLEFINFPIFNLADIFINVGVIILLISMFSDKNEQ